MTFELVLFYAFAALAVVSTLLVIGQSNPIYSVLLLIASFLALAALYVLLDAPFVAVTQIIVYAGAIMVLFLFVVMLLNVPREEPVPPGSGGTAESATTRWFGALLAVVMTLELTWALSRTRIAAIAAPPPGEAGASWSVAEIGRVLFTNYAFAFEVTSVLILIAMIGSIALAARHVTERRSWRG